MRGCPYSNGLTLRRCRIRPGGAGNEASASKQTERPSLWGSAIGGRRRSLTLVTDPEWLLATMAQSAAALVAIAGGFLVNRVLTLGTERQGLERRGRELEQQMRDQVERLQRDRQRRTGASWDRYVDLMAAACAARYETNGSVSPEWLVERLWLSGVPTREEMLRIAALLVEETKQASEHFERGESLPDSGTTDWAVYKIYQTVEAAREESVRVAQQAARHAELRAKAGRPPPSSSVYNRLRAAVSRSTRSQDSELNQSRQKRYAKLIEAERERQDRLALLEREHDFVRTEAARVAKPQGLWFAASAFSYLTVAGVVVPVVSLAWRPVPYNLLSRRWLVFLFVSGLLVLGWYLIWAIRQLSKDRDSIGADTGGERDVR